MKIKNRLWVPALFTFLYFAFAILVPVRATWFEGMIRIAVLLIAGLCSFLLWVSYIVLVRGARKSESLLMIALSLPVVLYGIPIAVLAVLSIQQKHLMEIDSQVKKEASILTIEDQELLTDHGNPVGVRVRYKVRYPNGAEALISHLPPANLSSAPDPYAKGFWVRSSQFHALSATDYEMSSDVVPEFMPQMLRFAEDPRFLRSGGKDPCFNWPGGSSERTAVLNTPPQTFRIYVTEPAYSGPTHASYDLHRFYEGAIQEGARECSSP
jgi:hypothetical protein